MDGGASSPATATPSESDTISCGNRFDWKFERLRPSRAHPEAEGTDSPPHHPFSDSAEILRISGRGICKEAIFSPGGQAPAPKKSAPGATNQNLRFRLVGREAACLPFGQATFPPRRSPASIGSREGSHPLELSGAVLMEKLISDEAGRSFEDFGSRRHERGALCSPTPPRVTGCERAATLSRSPGAVLARLWFPTMQAVLLWTLFLTTRAWDAPLPYTPSGDGSERAVTLSRSPGAVLVEIFVSDGAGCSPDGFCFRRRGRGALCSPTPPRVTGARGL